MMRLAIFMHMLRQPTNIAVKGTDDGERWDISMRPGPQHSHPSPGTRTQRLPPGGAALAGAYV